MGSQFSIQQECFTPIISYKSNQQQKPNMGNGRKDHIPCKNYTFLGLTYESLKTTNIN
ncbi:hypothetical protein HanRHA438_Chr01g0008191 [Helianthus annuus]|nr:hypothetical protein HanIR_Chr01g0008641 [Helianthus annuus]KAJ0946822.1 hypothetical protein HanRHA438_Chr01g0008191 [Helianthus annuus]